MHCEKSNFGELFDLLDDPLDFRVLVEPFDFRRAVTFLKPRQLADSYETLAGIRLDEAPDIAKMQAAIGSSRPFDRITFQDFGRRWKPRDNKTSFELFLGPFSGWKQVHWDMAIACNL